MQRAMYVVSTHPASPEAEEEYNRWYSDVHLGDVLRVPGVVNATRYARDDGAPAGAPYLALYELQAESINDTLAEIKARANTDQMVMSDALCTEGDRKPQALLYHLI